MSTRLSWTLRTPRNSLIWGVKAISTVSPRATEARRAVVEKKMARTSMEKLGITHLAKKCYRELSGGQQQRALIARALCATSEVLILDEPITGLDPSAIQDFYHLVRTLNKEEKVTIIMVTHDVANVVNQANKILHLKQKVLFYGTPEEYRKTKAGQLFLGGDL